VQNSLLFLQPRTTVSILSGILGTAWLVAVTVGPAVAQSSTVQSPAHEEYDVVALRVEFQPDTSRFTTGNGTFDGSIFDTLSVSIDPLPHDAGYFRAHLRFLKNYVRRVSDGRTRIHTHLIPEIVRLPHEMGYYSPTGPRAHSPEERQKLGRLVRDAWEQADREAGERLTGLDPDRTAFLLFHAGAGRDIELVGSSLTNTPEDIPSLFLDAATLDQMGVRPMFQGMPVTNSMILPETESRLGNNPLTEEPFVAEFSINGILAATFFNYLGVPDLFDTETGASGVGPFGLMDPLGIFAYNGLFPPEPTAWTKYYLGWIDPDEQALEDPTEVSLSAVADTSSSDAVLVRISGAEYFLVENRHRDPEMDGLRLRTWKDGRTTTQHISAGSDDFTRFDPAAFSGGVLTDVDTYDWAIPGGTTEDGEIMYGGIAVWHIDERQLVAGLSENRLNVDPRRRAVHLEEADGARDLGFAAQSLLGSGPEQGTPFDLFFRSNPVRIEAADGEEVRLYTNRFAPDTYPSSTNANEGPSFVELHDFSDTAPEMTLRARLTEVNEIHSVPPLRNFRVDARLGAGSALAGVMSSTDTTLYLSTGGLSSDSLYRLPVGSEGFTLSGEWIPEVAGTPVRFGDRLLTLRGAKDGTAWTLGANDSTRAELPVSGGSPVQPPVVLSEGEEEVLYAAFRLDERSVLVRWNGEEAVRVEDSALPADIVGLAAAGDERLAVVGRRKTVVRGGDKSWSYRAIGDGTGVGVAFGRDYQGLIGVLTDRQGDELVVLHPEGSVRVFNRNYGAGSETVHPAMSDLDGDGLLDVLVAEDERLVGLSRSGAVVEGFPITVQASIVTQPLIVRFSSESPWSVVAGGTDGYVYRYDIGQSDRPNRGFPLAVGHSVRTTPLLLGDSFFAVSGGGVAQQWRFPAVDSVAWGRLRANARNQNYVETGSVQPPQPKPETGSSLLVADRTYNWPNPVREGRTHFRFVVRKHAEVRVTIADMAGGLVEEIRADDVPPDAPYEVVWNTDVASGIYYARVRATAADGSTDTELITVAIIR
jgi:hypothetical protein